MIPRKSWRQKIGPAIGIIIFIYLSAAVIQAITRNHQLKKKISGLETELADLKGQKEELEYRIQYYQTENYKEKEARAKLGLQAPGEGVVILPKAQPMPGQDQQKPTAPNKSNFDLWWEFLFG